MGYVKARQRLVKVFLKLTAVVSLYVFYLPVKKVVETVEKVFRTPRGVRGIHPGKGQLGVLVNRGHNVALLSMDIAHHGVETHQETGDRFLGEVRNLFTVDRQGAFTVLSSLFYRVIVNAGALDNALDVPTGQVLVTRKIPAVQHEEFHLTVADVCPTEFDHAHVLERGVFPFPTFFWSARALLERTEVGFVKTLEPLVEGLPSDAEVASREARLFSLGFVEDDPFETALRGLGEFE